MPSLESRVAHLERQNRTLRASLLLTAVALVTCGGVTSNYERVNTNTLVIVDANERPVITLAASGTLTFADASKPVVLDAKTLAKLLAATAAATPSGDGG